MFAVVWKTGIQITITMSTGAQFLQVNIQYFIINKTVPRVLLSVTTRRFMPDRFKFITNLTTGNSHNPLVFSEK